MKNFTKLFLLIALTTLIFKLQTLNSFAQGTWVRKADLPGLGRTDALGFAIGNKGYIGIGDGYGAPPMLQDFWEYDPINDSWTQKADFPGGPRTTAVGFGISAIGKGYIGTGDDDDVSLYHDFWEYDQINDNWIQITDFPGGDRTDETGFSINGKGYVAIGSVGGNPNFKELWEYNPTGGTWTKKADYGGKARHAAAGFVIDTMAYIGTGTDDTVFFKDFWEWNQTTDIWTKKADFPGAARREAVGLSIGKKGYIGTGCCGGGYKDLWEWDGDVSSPTYNIWTKMADFPGGETMTGIAFTIGNKAYVGLGDDGSFSKKLYEFTPPEFVGIAENSLSKEVRVNIFPNPFSKNAWLRITNFSEYTNEKLELKIYNLLGKEVKQFHISDFRFQIDRNGLTDGIYFYQLKKGKEIIAKGKLVIQ